MASGKISRMPNEIRSIWSVLREPLTNLSFSQMKEAAAGAGLPVVDLNHLRQTSGSGSGGTTKPELADAIDGLFVKLGPQAQDRSAVHMVTELIRRSSPASRERLEELLERVGWHLMQGEPVPLSLRLDLPPDNLPETVRTAVAKAISRFRDGDFDGAMTSVVGAVDSLTEEIYTANGMSNHKRHPYQQRAITAHRTLEQEFRSILIGMTTAEADLAWAGQHRAVNGAADVLGAFRRSYSDAHGVSSADANIVQTALNSALFLIYNLSV